MLYPKLFPSSYILEMVPTLRMFSLLADGMQSHAAPLPTLCPLPVLGVCVLEQLRQLEGILADLLHRGQ